MTKMRHSEERVGDVRRGGLESGGRKIPKNPQFDCLYFIFTCGILILSVILCT